ncbi:MAG: aminotransferase class I/II-fold pyridoxal phosphate-dependent enzyme, partial [Saprospiraceae bacterium]|nr:aminotransferase class I/II-fold pyridoxal phosphate-dependent enzyme [Saprospiraceae bacterium]
MKNELTSLSSRGQSLASNPARIDFEIFAEASENLYCATTNPEGTFPLNIAENALCVSIIKEKLTDILHKNELPEWVMKYTDIKGDPTVRESVANFMENHLCKCPIDKDTIAFSAGASAIIEVTSFALANPRDVVVIPSPSYPMYTNDMGVKSGMERYDLNTHHDISEIGSSAPVTPKMLQETKDKLDVAGKCFKIFLITSPDNPTGCMYSESQLNTLAEWCISNEVHMIVNEIYGLSLIDTDNALIQSDYNEKTEFVSFATIMKRQNSPFLHLWYAFSKDFAMSGLRFGIVHSLNTNFIAALENVNIPHLVSNITQWMVGEMLKDRHFITSYIKENQRLLNRSYVMITQFLKKHELPYIPSRGSLFVWVDFSKYLKEDSDKGQEDLWLDIYRSTGIVLTPGMGFRHTKKGLFRIVFTAVQYEELEVALERLEGYL